MARQVILVALIVSTYGILLAAGESECSSTPCLNGGTCVQGSGAYTCTCVDGWTGTDCETEACATDSDCENGGTCKADKTCTCATGYAGDLCGTDIDECTVNNPCQNEAVCANEEPGYTCTCATGWTGTNCESDIDECASNPCQNAGECGDAVAGYTCTCKAGWTGTNCESESGASLSTASCLILALALALTKMATD